MSFKEKAEEECGTKKFSQTLLDKKAMNKKKESSKAIRQMMNKLVKVRCERYACAEGGNQKRRADKC